MKLYVTTYIDDAPETGEPGPRSWWDGTQEAQKQAAKNFKTVGMRNIEKQHVDVPTDKAGLLAFLNDKGVRP